MNLRYELRVVDEDTEEVIHQDTTLTLESHEESLHKVEKAIAEHLDKLEREAEEANQEENES